MTSRVLLRSSPSRTEGCVAFLFGHFKDASTPGWAPDPAKGGEARPGALYGSDRTPRLVLGDETFTRTDLEACNGPGQEATSSPSQKAASERFTCQRTRKWWAQARQPNTIVLGAGKENQQANQRVTLADILGPRLRGGGGISLRFQSWGLDFPKDLASGDVSAWSAQEVHALPAESEIDPSFCFGRIPMRRIPGPNPAGPKHLRPARAKRGAAGGRPSRETPPPRDRSRPRDRTGYHFRHLALDTDQMYLASVSSGTFLRITPEKKPSRLSVFSPPNTLVS